MTVTNRSLVTSIETYCGHYVDYLDPRADQIELADVARGLANTCRFAGQVTRFFGVAEHAVYVSEVAEYEMGVGDRELLLAALHHDSHEAYLGDWPSPLKYVFDSDLLKDLAHRFDLAVAEKFGFDLALFGHEVVKEADYLQLRREAATLKFSHGVGEHWRNSDAYAPMAGTGWSPDRAERKFLDRHRELVSRG